MKLEDGRYVVLAEGGKIISRVLIDHGHFVMSVEQLPALIRDGALSLKDLDAIELAIAEFKHTRLAHA